MELGKLRAAVRAHKGTVIVRAQLAGVTIDIPVQKTGFVKDSLEAFGDAKTDESGLTLTEDGIVMQSGGPSPAASVTENPAPSSDASDDLLSGDDDLLGGDDDLLGGDDDLLGGDDDLLGGDDPGEIDLLG